MPRPRKTYKKSEFTDSVPTKPITNILAGNGTAPPARTANPLLQPRLTREQMISELRAGQAEQ